MLVSWALLQEFININDTPQNVADRLTFSGSEVEGITYTAGKMKGIVAAKILTLKQNGKYYVAELDTGEGVKVCVTSATNMRQGNTVLYAGEGAVLPDGTVMGTRDFAAVQSFGMMLSAEELGLHDVDDPAGLLILPDNVKPGVDATTLYHIGDIVLDVSITPNRGDLLSHIGMAREIHGLFPHFGLKSPDWLKPFVQADKWPENFGNISLHDKGCINYRLGLATGATIGNSPLTAKIDLAHLGMRPINNAVDVTNYIMLALGQPLHAFDLNTLPAREITVRPAVDGEHMITLDGKDRTLTARDMLITSGGEAVAIAGVMGGQQTGINADTTTIVIESASFSPIRVGYTSRRLGINSEAAFRFSRTVDPNLSNIALMAASTLMHEWCGATVSYKPLCAENETYSAKPVRLTRRKLATYLSWDNFTEAAQILDGFGVKQLNNEEFLPPSWRLDITIEEDLIEEIGRFKGYNDAPDEFPGELPRRADIGDNMRLSGFIRQFLTARGYTEVLTYSFLPEDFPQKLRLSDDDLRAHPLIIANPISREQIAMRTTLLPGLLSGLKVCVASGWREPVRAFEQGRVFLAGNEPEHLAGLVFNGKDDRSPTGDRSDDFYSVKSDVEALIRARGYVPEFRAGSETFMHSGQIAHILIDGSVVGCMGRLKPAIEQELDATGVYVFELDATGLAKSCKPVYTPSGQFPASLRDISLLVALDRPNSDVMADIRSACGSLLDGLRLFDVYTGQGIPEGYRSLAYTLSYRAQGRTLRDEEVDAEHTRLREALTAKGYTLR